VSDPWLQTGWSIGVLERLESSTDLAKVVDAVLAARGALPPSGLVADLASLALGGTGNPSARGRGMGGRPIRDALRSVEDLALARLRVDPLLDEVADALRGLSGDLRWAAAGWMVATWLDRVGVAGRAPLPAAVRRLGVDGAAAVDAEQWPDLALALRQWAEAAAGVARWIDPDDLRVLRAFPHLDGAAQRLAFRQMVDLATSLQAGLPSPKRRSVGGNRSSERPSAGAPMGEGYAEVARTSRLTALLPSEWADALAVGDSDGLPDRFAARWAQGELLGFTADAAVGGTPPRTWVLAMDPGLAAHRFRDPGAPAQRLVLALASLVAAARWLLGARVPIWVYFPPDASGSSPLAREAERVGLALRGVRGAGLRAGRVVQEPVPTAGIAGVWWWTAARAPVVGTALHPVGPALWLDPCALGQSLAPALR
jgi:hypothetical protein